MEVLLDECMEEEEDTQKDRYLTFNLEKECYGIEIKYVTEIIGIQEITKIPELPEFVRGIINLRGKIIPLLDVRIRFKKNFREYNDRTCVVVVDIMDLFIGLIVDNVAEVLSIQANDIVDPPNLSKDMNNKYIKKIGKVGNGIKLILDCEKLLTEFEFEELNSSTISR